MKKQTRLFAAIALLVNAFTSLILFFIFLAKKKSIAGAFAAVAAVTGTIGGYLLYEEKVAKALKEKCCCKKDGECDCENCECNCEDGECTCEEGECKCSCGCKCEEEKAEEEGEDLDLGSEELFVRDEEEN